MSITKGLQHKRPALKRAFCVVKQNSYHHAGGLSTLDKQALLWMLQYEILCPDTEKQTQGTFSNLTRSNILSKNELPRRKVVAYPEDTHRPKTRGTLNRV